MNEIKQFYIMCGIPGSGKSTFAKKITEIYEKHNISIETVSRDEIRFSLIKPGEEYSSQEKEVFSIYIENLKKSLNNNNITIADATHLNFASRKKLLTPLVKDLKNVDIFLVKMETSLETALERNEKRKGTDRYVPRGVIRRMYFSMDEPQKEEGFDIVPVKEKEGE